MTLNVYVPQKALATYSECKRMEKFLELTRL